MTSGARKRGSCAPRNVSECAPLRSAPQVSGEREEGGMNGQSDERRFLRHTVATLAYRAGKALRGAPEGFGVSCCFRGLS
jgi:hypothetical protein